MLVLGWLAVIAACGGCAFDLAHVEQTPATLSASATAPRSFVLDQEVALTLPLGYRRTLRRNSTWTYVGTLAAGDVYTTKDQVLTVEASNIHEAYIVVKGARLVGFYLPVERTFSPAAAPVTLPLRILP
jgi:hypothetical protein